MLRIAHALHSPRLHRFWQLLWLALATVACGFAFTPGEIAPTLGFGDKVNHIAAFAALGWVGALALPAGWRGTLLAAAAGLCVGVFIELVQATLPSRTAEAADLLGDALGLFVGLALTALLRQLWLPEKI